MKSHMKDHECKNEWWKSTRKREKNEVLAKEEEKEISEVEKRKLKKKASNKGKVVLDHPPIQHLPYPNAPSKKD